MSDPFLIQQSIYFFRGTLKKFQNFFMNLLLIPSSPGADFILEPSRDLSNSSKEKGCSKFAFSPSESLHPKTNGWLHRLSPKNSSIEFSCRIMFSSLL